MATSVKNKKLVKNKKATKKTTMPTNAQKIASTQKAIDKTRKDGQKRELDYLHIRYANQPHIVLIETKKYLEAWNKRNALEITNELLLDMSDNEDDDNAIYTCENIAYNSSNFQAVNIKTYPKSFLHILELTVLFDGKEKLTQLVTATKRTREELGKVVVTDLQDFANLLMMAEPEKNAILEASIGGGTYPVLANVSYFRGMFGPKCYIDMNIKLIGQEISIYQSFDGSTLDKLEYPQGRTVEAILADVNLKLYKGNSEEYAASLAKFQKIVKDLNSKQMLITGPCFRVFHSMWGGASLVEQRCGTPERPEKGLLENLLEITGTNDRNSRGCPVPLARVFLLSRKEYVYISTENLKEYKYDKTAIDRLFVPAEMGSVLTKVLTTDPSKMFGDLLAGKHGGLIVMASGQPGTGKTLTAEVFAEYTERPLYIMEMGELGVQVDTVEESLKLVFQRAERWNAVVLFDEADIFMTKRGEDLEKSAIVGIFLRLLDYYPGILFLTTNLPDQIDDAVLSRVTLHLKYPPLDADRKEKIWRTMLEKAGFGTMDTTPLTGYAMNGRQIRSAVRLLGILHEDRKASIEDVKKAMYLVQK